MGFATSFGANFCLSGEGRVEYGWLVGYLLGPKQLQSGYLPKAKASSKGLETASPWQEEAAREEDSASVAGIRRICKTLLQ